MPREIKKYKDLTIQEPALYKAIKWLLSKRGKAEIKRRVEQLNYDYI